MSAERDLAEAIHHEITAPEHVRHALDLWNYATRQYLWSNLDCLRYVIDGTSAMAIDRVLARRQREAARTGPWDGNAVRECPPQLSAQTSGVGGSRLGPPGSPEARGAGCTCPILDNAHGKGIPYHGRTHWWIDAGCPLHGGEP